MKGSTVNFVKSNLAEIVFSRQSGDLPELSEEDQLVCIRKLAQEAMEAIPAYLAQLRNN